MQPYGDLPWGIVGWKANGKLQVIPFKQPHQLYTSPLKFFEVTWEDLVLEAGKTHNRVHKKPRYRIIKLDKYNEWQLFMAWQCRHWWDDNNMLFRIHGFFRTMRQPPSSSNVIRRGNRINYVDATTSKWLGFIKGDGSNEGTWEELDKDSSANEGSWERLNQEDTDACESFHLI